MQSLIDQHETQLLWHDLLSHVEERIQAAIANLEGAHRAYTWGIGNPSADPPETPPAPFLIDLRCKPIEFTAVCHKDTPPSSTTFFDLARSIDGGYSFDSCLQIRTKILAGTILGTGAVFRWMYPETRVLASVGADGAVPLEFQAGDIVMITTPSTDAKAITVQLRVQRTGEFAQRGR